jgi:nickel/cobalt transporter (NiCoT) family protein
MRHAFDADHIAAIDNTTRKLMAEDQRPVSVGFWFSLGHSTIVFTLVLLLGLGVRSLAGQVENDSSSEPVQPRDRLLGHPAVGAWAGVVWAGRSSLPYCPPVISPLRLRP